MVKYLKDEEEFVKKELAEKREKNEERLKPAKKLAEEEGDAVAA